MPGSPPPCHHAGGSGPWNSRPCDCARPVETFTAPSCADLDLEPLASPRAARRAYAAVVAARKLNPPPRLCSRGCGQTMINDQAGDEVCVTCRRAERAHQGEPMRLFTPAPAQLNGQEGLFT